MLKKIVLFLNKNVNINYIFRKWQWFYDWLFWIYNINIFSLKFKAMYDINRDKWKFSFLYNFIIYTINTTYSKEDLINITNHLVFLRKWFLSLNWISLLNSNWKSIIILSPSWNWKTTYVKNNILKNSNLKLLNDDIVFLNPVKNTILVNSKEIFIEKIIFYSNSSLYSNINFNNENIFLISLWVNFLWNELSKNIISVEWLKEDFDNLYTHFLKLKIYFININNYDYEELNRSIWLE